MAAELRQILVELGLEQYFPDCLRAGFRNWESLSYITEVQLAAINFRLGHRRKLQREIARRQLQWPDHRPLPTALDLQQQSQSSYWNALRAYPELLEESYQRPPEGFNDYTNLAYFMLTFCRYSLASTPQLSWSRDTCSSDDTDAETRTNQDLRRDTRLLVNNLLCTSSRGFSSLVPPDRLRDSGREKVSQILHTLDCMGIHVPFSADYQHTDARATSSLVDEVYYAISFDPKVSMPPGDLQADNVEAFDRPPNCQLVELLLECFLQNINHVLFSSANSSCGGAFAQASTC